MSYYAFNDKGLSDNPTTVIDLDTVHSIVTNGNTITCYIYNGNIITLDISNYPSDFASTLIETFLEYKNPQEVEEMTDCEIKEMDEVEQKWREEHPKEYSVFTKFMNKLRGF